MDPREDEDPPFDDSDNNDPIIRELRTEMVRLQAELDQLTAAVRERAEEAAALRAQLTEHESRVADLKSRYRKRIFLWVFAAGLYGTAIGLALSLVLRP